MVKTISTQAFLFILFGLFTAVSIAGDGYGHKNHNEYYSNNYTETEGAGGMHTDSEILLVKLTGTGVGYHKSIPGFDDEALCFDIDLVDLKSNKIIGGATDCISDEQINVDGVEFIGTTYLYFADGVIATRGTVSVRSVEEENIVLRTGQKITNLTGSATTGNTFIEGENTGIYENRTGNTRISGMINTENFAFNEGDEQFFDCIFEIHLDTAVNDTAVY